MGLSHPNRFWDEDGDGEFEDSSFTRSWGAAVPGGVTAGPDGVRGTRDDQHLAPGGMQPAESVSWFRRSDNDPFVIDDLVIDSNTFSRSTATNLPSGHTWAANGNREVAESMGLEFTQAVMYSLGTQGLQYSGLSADEVNMVKMGMTGEDLTAGTPDDYSVELVYLDDCDSDLNAIRVTFSDLSPGSVGSCQGVDADYSFPPSNPFFARHFSVVQIIGAVPPFIRLNSALKWNTEPPLVPVIFRSGFESGDLNDWDASAS